MYDVRYRQSAGGSSSAIRRTLRILRTLVVRQSPRRGRKPRELNHLSEHLRRDIGLSP